jgi:hypothetical protein
VAILIVTPDTSLAELGRGLLDAGIITHLDARMAGRGYVVGQLDPFVVEGGALHPDLNPWLVWSGLVPGELNPLLEGGFMMGELDHAFSHGVLVGEYEQGGLSLHPALFDNGTVAEQTTPDGGVIMGEFSPDLFVGGIIMGEYDPDASGIIILGGFDAEGLHHGDLMGTFNPQLEFGVGVSPPGLVAISSDAVNGSIVGEVDPETRAVSSLRLEATIPRRALRAAIGG